MPFMKIICEVCDRIAEITKPTCHCAGCCGCPDTLCTLTTCDDCMKKEHDAQPTQEDYDKEKAEQKKQRIVDAGFIKRKKRKEI